VNLNDLHDKDFSWLIFRVLSDQKMTLFQYNLIVPILQYRSFPMLENDYIAFKSQIWITDSIRFAQSWYDFNSEEP